MNPDADLKSLKFKFQQWRSKRTRGARIPNELWNEVLNLSEFIAIAKLVKELGLCRASLTNKLNSNSTKFKRQKRDRPAREVKLVPLTSTDPKPAQSLGSEQLIAEISGRSGLMLRIFKGIDQETMKCLTSLI